MKIIDVSVFGAMGDWKSDVEKPSKKFWRLDRITNDIQFLKLSKSNDGARSNILRNPIGKLGGVPPSTSTRSFKILIELRSATHMQAPW